MIDSSPSSTHAGFLRPASPANEAAAQVPDAKTFGYCRVSRDDFRRHAKAANNGSDEANFYNQSIQLQADKLAEAHKAKTLPGSIDYYTDAGVSGSVPLGDRPGGKQLLVALRPGDHVVITKVDRGFRNTRDCLATVEMWKRKGVHVHILDLPFDIDTPIGEAMLGVIAIFAQFERARIKERIREAKAEAKRSSRWDGYAAYGFRRDGDRLVADPRIRHIMRLLLEWRARRPPLTWRSIADHLKKEGSCTPTGKPWRRESLIRCWQAAKELGLDKTEKAI